ncbi:hypothetical protein VPH13_12285 [Stenotrophomonas pavanii]|uniref:hypothetical protein n=1 Tax=Stenotrophomonas pavanii TaxID=487698 RepID=UPI0019D4816C|nr:hypothetical protein [Stenotrophomonas pavanii]MBN7836295.1 hypothetical protein [Stenotrophomonas maltophilia]MEC4339493.1 hypothetical protein [Stenotrophomonas pavanii]
MSITMSFHFRPANKLSCMAEIYPFIELFAEQHRHRFVLAFQYERDYSVRDNRWLEFLSPFPD